MTRLFALLVASLVLSGCVVGDLPFGTTRQAIFSADTPDNLIALGGVRIMGDEINTALIGQTFEEPNERWLWDINTDGTQYARDVAGEWADSPNGLWQIVDDMFCRENEDLALKCSEVYRAGPYYRMTEPDGRLALWTMTMAMP